MPLLSATDLSGMLATFGESVTLDDGTIAGKSVTGVFAAPFTRADVVRGGVESYAPQLTLASADAATVAHGTRVTRQATGCDYYVTEMQPYGQGLVKLILGEEEVDG